MHFSTLPINSTLMSQRAYNPHWYLSQASDNTSSQGSVKPPEATLFLSSTTHVEGPIKHQQETETVYFWTFWEKVVKRGIDMMFPGDLCSLTKVLLSSTFVQYGVFDVNHSRAFKSLDRDVQCPPPVLYVCLTPSSSILQVIQARLCTHPSACLQYDPGRRFPQPDHRAAVRRRPEHQLPHVHLQLVRQALGGKQLGHTGGGGGFSLWLKHVLSFTDSFLVFCVLSLLSW